MEVWNRIKHIADRCCGYMKCLHATSIELQDRVEVQIYKDQIDKLLNSLISDI